MANATAPDRLAEVLLSEPVLTEARKELNRRSGQAIDAADLGRLLRESVLRPELTK